MAAYLYVVNQNNGYIVPIPRHFFGMIVNIGQGHYEPVGLIQQGQFAEDNVAEVTSLFCKDFDGLQSFTSVRESLLYPIIPATIITIEISCASDNSINSLGLSRTNSTPSLKSPASMR